MQVSSTQFRSCGRLAREGRLDLLQAATAGARSIIILDCLFPGHHPISPRSLADAMLFAATVVVKQQTAAALAALAADVSVLYLPGPAPTAVSPLNFSRTLDFIETGYAAARAFLDTWSVAHGPTAEPARVVGAVSTSGG